MQFFCLRRHSFYSQNQRVTPPKAAACASNGAGLHLQSKNDASHFVKFFYSRPFLDRYFSRKRRLSCSSSTTFIKNFIAQNLKKNWSKKQNVEMKLSCYRTNFICFVLFGTQVISPDFTYLGPHAQCTNSETSLCQSSKKWHSQQIVIKGKKVWPIIDWPDLLQSQQGQSTFLRLHGGARNSATFWTRTSL